MKIGNNCFKEEADKQTNKYNLIWKTYSQIDFPKQDLQASNEMLDFKLLREQILRLQQRISEAYLAKQANDQARQGKARETRGEGRG